MDFARKIQVLYDQSRRIDQSRLPTFELFYVDRQTDRSIIDDRMTYVVALTWQKSYFFLYQLGKNVVNMIRAKQN